MGGFIRGEDSRRRTQSSRTPLNPAVEPREGRLVGLQNHEAATEGEETGSNHDRSLSGGRTDPHPFETGLRNMIRRAGIAVFSAP